MKKMIILSLILAAGLTAYPQSNRSSREANSKSRSSQVSSRSSSQGRSKQVKSTGSNQTRSKATSARSSSSRSAVNRSSSNNSRSSAVRSNSGRSSSANAGSAAVKSGTSRSGSSGAVRSSSRSSRSSGTLSSTSRGSRSSGVVRSSRSNESTSGGIKSGNNSSRSSGAISSGNTSRSSRSGGTVSSANRSKSSSGISSAQRSARSSAGQVERNVVNSARSGSAVKSNAGDKSSSATGRTSADKASRTRSTTGDSFNRSNRQGDKVYVRSDGSKFRHQNDEVFSRTRYRVDYRDVNELRRSRDFVRVKNHYHNWYSHRHIRRVVVHNHFYHPLPLSVRIVRYPYRRPVHIDLCWTPYLYNRFVYYYPMHRSWNINYGDYIATASSYEAANYAGTVKRIYGRVEEVYYSPEDRTYTLYFGARFPYHDFSVVVPRDVAKSFSWSPSWYFEDEHVWVVGLIEMWEGKPEIVIHDEQQIRRY